MQQRDPFTRQPGHVRDGKEHRKIRVHGFHGCTRQSPITTDRASISPYRPALRILCLSAPMLQEGLRSADSKVYGAPNQMYVTASKFKVLKTGRWRNGSSP